MMFPRYKGKELHERSWCPSVIRDGLTDFLSFFAEFSGLRGTAYRRLASLLCESGEVRVTELCGGSGFSAFHMLRRLEKLGCGGVSVKVTDVESNANWDGLVAASDGRLSSRRVDAETALGEECGVFVMFAALHHFSREEMSRLVKAAVMRGKPALFVDYFSRGRIVDLFPLLAGPLLMSFTAPLVYPFSWRRLFWTWVVPVLPLMLFVDTALSLMRVYTVQELKEMVASISVPDGADVEVAELISAFGIVKMPAIVVTHRVFGQNDRQ